MLLDAVCANNGQRDSIRAKELLDAVCANSGMLIADEVNDENIITKALGVLQEDGLYAFFLYLKAIKQEGFSKKAVNLLEIAELIKINTSDILKSLQNGLCNDLDRLIFAKNLLEKALIYARYHAKAKKNKKEQSETGGK